MPIVQIQILEGRSIERKKNMIKQVTDAIVESMDVPIENIRVIITEIPHEHWGTGGKTKDELNNS